MRNSKNISTRAESANNGSMDPVVHIVDDDPLTCKTLGILVSSVGLQVETYGSAEGFLAKRSRLARGAECLVLDLCLPGMGGLILLERLVEDGVGIPTIVISAFVDVPTAVESMKYGATTVIKKPFSAVKLLEQIQAALELGSRQPHNGERTALVGERLATLTAREREVMDLMIAGKTAKQIGRRFGIGVKTVAKHRAKVLDKLQVENTVDLVHLAYECGLIQNASQRSSTRRI